MTTGINMHGNPMVIVSTYIPHDQTLDTPRQQAWELLDETVAQAPIAKHDNIASGFQHHYTRREKRRRRLHWRAHFRKRMRFLTFVGNYKPAWEIDNREMLANLIRTQDLIIKNTFFEQSARQQIG